MGTLNAGFQVPSYQLTVDSADLVVLARQLAWVKGVEALHARVAN